MDSLLSKSDIDKIDKNVIHLFYGYIRRVQPSLDRIIPDEIVLICISFHYLNEYFAVAAPDYRIHSSNCKVIEKIKRAYRSSAYGNVLISSARGGIYSWTFKILSTRTSMYIGISSEYDRTDVDVWKGSYGKTFCFSTTGTLVRNMERLSSGNSGFDAGDTLIMKLDLNQQKLRYESEQHPSWKGVGFDNIPCGVHIQYKMAISFLNEASKIALVDFCVE